MADPGTKKPTPPWGRRPYPGPMSLVTPVERLRVSLAEQVRGLIVGDHPPVRHHDDPVLGDPTAGDPGFFGPDSVTWRVHADSAMFIGGLRALLLQTVHPLAMAGVAEHSQYRSDPMGRLWRTSVYVGTTTYGTVEQAAEAVAHVKQAHVRVTGTAPDGRPYAANDPHLLTWVHHTLVDSFLRAYRRYGAAPLTPQDADRYLDEMAVLCDLFGAEPAARSTDELRDYFADVRPELHAGAQARDAARFLLVPPLPLPARGAYAVIAPAAVGLLPASVRRALWIPPTPGFDPLVVRPSARLLLRTLDWVMAALPRPSRDAER